MMKKQLYMAALLAVCGSGLQAMELPEEKKDENCNSVQQVVAPKMIKGQIQSLQQLCAQSFGDQEDAPITAEYLRQFIDKQEKAVSFEDKQELKAYDSYAATIAQHAPDNVINDHYYALLKKISSPDMPEFNAASIDRLMKLLPIHHRELATILADTKRSLHERAAVAKNLSQKVWNLGNNAKIFTGIALEILECRINGGSIKVHGSPAQLSDTILCGIVPFVSKDVFKKIVKEIACSGPLSQEMIKIIIEDRLLKDELYNDYFKKTFLDESMMQHGNRDLLFNAIKNWWKNYLHTQFCSGKNVNASKIDSLSADVWDSKYQSLADKKLKLMLTKDSHGDVLFSYADGAVSGKIPAGIKIGNVAIDETTIYDLVLNDAQDKLAVIAFDRVENALLFIIFDYSDNNVAMILGKKITRQFGFDILDICIVWAEDCLACSAITGTELPTASNSTHAFNFYTIKTSSFKQPSSFLEYMKLAWAAQFPDTFDVADIQNIAHKFVLSFQSIEQYIFLKIFMRVLVDGPVEAIGKFKALIKNAHGKEDAVLKDALKECILNDMCMKKMVIEAIEFNFITDEQLKKDIPVVFDRLENLIDDEFMLKVLFYLRKSDFFEK